MPHTPRSPGRVATGAAGAPLWHSCCPAPLASPQMSPNVCRRLTAHSRLHVVGVALKLALSLSPAAAAAAAARHATPPCCRMVAHPPRPGCSMMPVWTGGLGCPDGQLLQERAWYGTGCLRQCMCSGHASVNKGLLPGAATMWRDLSVAGVRMHIQIQVNSVERLVCGSARPTGAAACVVHYCGSAPTPRPCNWRPSSGPDQRPQRRVHVPHRAWCAMQA